MFTIACSSQRSAKAKATTNSMTPTKIVSATGIYGIARLYRGEVLFFSFISIVIVPSPQFSSLARNPCISHLLRLLQAFRIIKNTNPAVITALVELLSLTPRPVVAVRHASVSTGILMIKVVPFPTSLSTSIVPLCF